MSKGLVKVEWRRERMSVRNPVRMGIRPGVSKGGRSITGVVLGGKRKFKK